MKKLLTAFALLAMCQFANGQDEYAPDLKKIRTSVLRLNDIVQELSATPGFARLTDGNGWTLYVSYKVKKKLTKVWIYNSSHDFIDMVRLCYDGEKVFVKESEYGLVTNADFYTYLSHVPQKIDCKVIWRWLLLAA
jgi:hypothetical protein